MKHVKISEFLAIYGPWDFEKFRALPLYLWAVGLVMSKIVSRMDGNTGTCRTGKIIQWRFDSLKGLLLLLTGMVGGVPMEIDLMSDLRRVSEVYEMRFLGKLLAGDPPSLSVLGAIPGIVFAYA